MKNSKALKKHYKKLKQLRGTGASVFKLSAQIRNILEDDFSDLTELARESVKLDHWIYNKFKTNDNHIKRVSDISVNRNSGSINIEMNNGSTHSHRIQNVDDVFELLKGADFRTYRGFIVYVLLCTDYLDNILINKVFDDIFGGSQ